MDNKKKGLVHLYVGDGKGKTTAATGLSVRARGNGNQVLFSQFLKGRGTGEIAALEQLGVTCIRSMKSSTKFVFQLTKEELEEVRSGHLDMVEQIRDIMAQGKADLVVLDEVVDAVNAEVLPLDVLLDLVNSRPDHVEIVMTGRNPCSEICNLTDYYTFFACAKHPYRNGVPARKGIEF